MPERAICAEGLVKRFGPVEVLNGVDIEARTATVLGLLGPNGAGKTTTVRILSTLLRADAGVARVAGADVAAEPMRVRRAIGLSGQYAAVDPYLTGRENLAMIGRLSGLGRKSASRRAAELLGAFGLEVAADRIAGGYSGGMRRRLDVAASLVAEPDVLFLDEPTTGLDPHGRAGLWRLVTDLVEQGTTVLLTTQYLEEADRVADTIAVMADGRVIASGTPDELKDRVGGDRLELEAAPGADPSTLAAAVAGLGSEAPIVDAETGVVTVPGVRGGAVREAAAALGAAEAAVAGVFLRRPSMDEVFLTLTGRQTTAALASEGADDEQHGWYGAQRR